ncbi:MAG: anthranilate phosphoribosyltransferase [Gaiellales bacterium]
MIRATIDELLNGESLPRGRARELMAMIMDGELTPVQIAGVLVALRAKGETADEITGFVEAMWERAVPVTPTRETIDIVGTGGDGASTFNISTAAGIVAAAAGAAVAKHGNRAASSSTGSADVLEELGVTLEQAPERIAESIDELGFGFMFARAHHPAMRHAAPVRQELGTRTVFNILGPLANPAGARDGVFGVFSTELAHVYAEALRGLGARHAFVVHGAGGLDELSPTGRNLVLEIRAGAIEEWWVDPDDVGLDRAEPESLAGGSPQANAATIRSVFAGAPGGARDAVAMNAGFGLVAAGVAETPSAGVALALATIAGGAAAERLEQLISFAPGVV